MLQYKLHTFIEKKTKRFVEWNYDYRNFYEKIHKNSRKSSPLIEERIMPLEGIVRKMERKLIPVIDQESEIVQMFNYQTFLLAEGKESKIKIKKYELK